MNNSTSFRKRIIREALQKRLSEVLARLDGATPMPVPGPEEGCQDDLEELLRVLMVRLWLRMTDGRATDDDKRMFFLHLQRLAGMALSEDWRYLDAFNNAYEAVVKQEWSEEELRENVMPFFQQYSFLVEAHLKRI